MYYFNNRVSVRKIKSIIFFSQGQILQKSIRSNQKSFTIKFK